MMRVSDLDTPAILIDLDIMERNLRRVADYSRQHGLRLRPHTKTHKIPALGERQLALGAAGLTVAKSTEAEVMLAAGPVDLLVAYPVIGTRKLERLMGVAARTDVTVSLDSDEAARSFPPRRPPLGIESACWLRSMSDSAASAWIRIPDSSRWRKASPNCPGLEFRGVAFYPGHIKATGEEAAGQLKALDTLLEETLVRLRAAGLEATVVSGGSTPTLFQSHCVRGMNEIRPGTYIFNDRNTWLSGACSFEDCAATILVTVVSTAVPGRMIVDGGSKTFSSDRCVAGEGFGHLLEARRHSSSV